MLWSLGALDGHVDGVVVLAKPSKVRIDARLRIDLDAAVKQPLNLAVEILARKTIARDAIAEHATQPLALLEDRGRKDP